MSLQQTRQQILQKIQQAAQRDARIVGLVDYGSTSQGRGDEWSDLDLAFFIQDEALADFEAHWETWMAQFQPVLLTYISGVGHPWMVFDTDPIPLRADLNIFAASDLAQIQDWPCTPISVDKMVLYDDSGGEISRRVAAMVGQSLAPADLQKTFQQVCGDFWYYLLRIHVKLIRGEIWAARWEFNFIIMGNLMGLLRLEANQLGRWRGSSAPNQLEQDLPPHRLAELEGCIPGPSPESLRQTLGYTARLGYRVCRHIAAQHTWPWPETLGQRVVGIFQESGIRD